MPNSSRILSCGSLGSQDPSGDPTVLIRHTAAGVWRMYPTSYQEQNRRQPSPRAGCSFYCTSVRRKGEKALQPRSLCHRQSPPGVGLCTPRPVRQTAWRNQGCVTLRCSLPRDCSLRPTPLGPPGPSAVKLLLSWSHSCLTARLRSVT